MGKRSVSIIAFIAVFAAFGNAFAVGENIITSKAYVDSKDALKQDVIPATEDDGVYSVLTDGDEDGEIGKMTIVTSSDNDGDPLTEWEGEDGSIPTVGFVADAAQSKISGYQHPNALNPLSSVITDTDTAGVIAKRAVLDAGGEEMTTSSIILNTLLSEGTLLTQSGTSLVSSYFGLNAEETAQSVVSARHLSEAFGTKQNKILAHAQNAADSVLTDSTTDGTVQKRAIFDGATTYAAATHSTHIPTMGAVMSAITANGAPAALSWTSADTTAVNNYSTTFDDSTGNWATADSSKMVTGTTLASGLSLKQNKIPGYDSTNAVQSVITDTTTDGVVGKRAVLGTPVRGQLSTYASHLLLGTMEEGESGFSALQTGYKLSTTDEKENSLVSLKLLNETFKLNRQSIQQRQENLAANNSTTYPNGSVVTYGTTAGTPGQVGIATTVSHNATTGALENGSEIASIAAVDTRQAKRVCVGWATGHENDDDYCYFWEFPNN